MPTTLSPDQISLLETTPLFAGISREILEKNLSAPIKITLKKGDHLLVPGQTSGHIYIIASGRISIQLTEADSKPITMYGQGESVGEMSILGDGHTPAFVMAATDCELLAIEHTALWSLIEASHKAASNILHILSQRAQINDRLISESLEGDNGYQGFNMVNKVTGLYNERWMNKELGRYLKRCLVDNRFSCLMMLEIDGQKDYTEKYGELGSDQALRTFAHTVISCQRPEDQAGHHAGSKFVVFLPYTTNIEAACIAAERLHLAINRADIVLPSGDALPHISASIGVAQLRDDGLAGLLARAGKALLDAQQNGGNCVRSIA
jgi:diguanylate cyclase (GGDEF)-like protein